MSSFAPPLLSLSDSLSVGDFCRSAKAAALKLDNSLPLDLLPNARVTAAGLRVVERDFGRFFTMTSGFRSAAVNAAVGGASDSDHMRAFAVDGFFAGVGWVDSLRWVERFAPSCRCLELRPNGIHLSWRPRVERLFLYQGKTRGPIVAVRSFLPDGFGV